MQQLLAAFDALPDADKHQAAVGILRRLGPADGDVPDAGLLDAADALFRGLEGEEARHTPR